MLMVGLVVPVWAEPADDLDSVSAGLAALLEPMEKKVDDCDLQVEEAERALKETQSKIEQAQARVERNWREMDILRRTLAKKDCKIEIRGETYGREAIAQALEKVLENYESNSSTLNQLQEESTTRSGRLEESLAKQQRWRAKEAALLQRIANLEEARVDTASGSSSRVSPSALKEATDLEADLKSMLEDSRITPAKQTSPPRQDNAARSQPKASLSASVRKPIAIDIEIDVEQATATSPKSSSQRPRTTEIDIDAQTVSPTPPAQPNSPRPVAPNRDASVGTQRPAPQRLTPPQAPPASPSSPSSRARGSIVRQNGPTKHRPTSHGPSHSISPGLLDIDVDRVGGQWDSLGIIE